MSLVLSTTDRVRLQKALEVISAPLDAPSMAQWRTDVLSTLAPLFQADAGAFVLPGDGESDASLLNRPASYVEDYVKVQSQDSSMELWDDFDGVTCTESLTRGNRATYTNSEIYSLFFGRYDVEDGVFTTFGLSDKPPMIAPGRPFMPGGMTVQGMLCLYGDRAGRARLGVDGLELMSLVRPVLRSAAQTWRDLGHRRAEMMALIDLSGDALAVYDAAGILVHRNPAVCALIACDSSWKIVEDAASRIASSLARVLDSRDGAIEQSCSSALEHEVATGCQRYELRATRTRSLLGARGAIVVSVQPLTSRLPSTASIRHMGLTTREAEVARMLAAGASNKTMSISLGVTEHTARRHTENVFRKLRVNSRSQVAARLVGVEY